MFPTAYAMLFHQSLAFQDMAQFKHFTGLNLLERAYNVIRNREIDDLQLYLMMLAYFLLAVTVEGDESGQLRMAN